MPRPLSILIALLFTALASAGAGLSTGSWRQFPAFGKFSDMADTPTSIYYVTAGSLYSYDKDSDETRHYEAGRDLSDYAVEKIFYNYDDRYLLVVFDNGNLDVIYPDGHKVNLPDIKDASVGMTKKVNDVKFHDGAIYIATSFGLVIYNGTTHEVRESGVYNRPVKCLAVDSKRILFYMGDTEDDLYKAYTIGHGERINKLDNFTPVGKGERGMITAIHSLPETDPNFGIYYPVIQWNTVRRLDIGNGMIFNSDISASRICRGADGLYFFSNTTPSSYCTFNEYAMGRRDTEMPAIFDGNLLAAWEGLQSVWAGDPSGLGNYSVGTDGTVTVKRDKSLSSDAISMTNICRIYPTADGAGFYTANIGQSHTHPLGTNDRQTTPMEGCLYRDGEFTPFNPEDGDGKTIIAPTGIAEDPANPANVYVASTARGIYVFRDGAQVALVDGSNSPMTMMKNQFYSPSSLAFDRFGNLWAGYVTSEASIPSVMMLPADKCRDIASAQKADWLQPDFGSHLRFKDVTVFPCRKTDIVIAFDGKDYSGFMAYYHAGRPTDLSASANMSWTTMTDQDGKTFSPEFILSVAEDHDGRLWFGTTQGVFSVPNPLRTMDPGFTINRVKVPRNDGTNLADYLLESDKVCAIAVDHSNRKWLGTVGSGLFLVSENGDEILANYNTSNSPLPTNCITAIYPDPNSSSVFIGTMAGLLEFSSTSGPARPDYSDVNIYPNPVAPDFTGFVTIEGLMGDSMLKIVDAGFNTVSQIQSEGGKAMWDVTNFGGERVRSGVYYVLASVSDESSSAGDVVGKILVIN